MLSINILKFGQCKKCYIFLGKYKTGLFPNHLSSASAIEKFECTLESRINFNSASSDKTLSNLLGEYWEMLLNAADLLEEIFAFYISLRPLKSSLKDLAKQISREEQ